MRQKMVINLLVVVFFMLSAISCVGTTAEVKNSPSSPTIDQAIRYTGPKARISISNIKCKAAKCDGIGTGLRDMLVSALFQTNKFVVLGGKEEVKEIQEELDIAPGKYEEEETTPEETWEGADVIILGAITAFEPNASGVGGGIGGLAKGILGGIGLSKNDAYIAMDLRIVDIRTRRIVNTTTVEGKASSFKAGLAGGGVIGTVPVGGAIGGYKNTPMEKAIRVMLQKAVDYIATQTPESYFRYSE